MNIRNFFAKNKRSDFIIRKSKLKDVKNIYNAHKKEIVNGHYLGSVDEKQWSSMIENSLVWMKHVDFKDSDLKNIYTTLERHVSFFTEFFTIEKNGIFLGHFVLRHLNNKNSELYTITIEQNQRGNNISSIILNYVERKYPQVNLYARCLPKSTAMKHILKKHGFKTVQIQNRTLAYESRNPHNTELFEKQTTNPTKKLKIPRLKFMKKWGLPIIPMSIYTVPSYRNLRDIL